MGNISNVIDLILNFKNIYLTTINKQYHPFHHVKGRALMIQRVIFIKCLSANQNQLFYLKV